MAMPGRKRKDGTTPWRAHWRDDTGRSHNRSFETHKAALDWEAKMRRERDDHVLGRNTLARETKLNDWIVEWWERELADNPLATQEAYSHVINRYIAPEIGELAMIDLTTPRVAQMRDDLLRQSVSASEVRYSLAVLSSCLGQAVERGLLPSNPCREVKKPKTPGGRKQKWPLSPEEVELLRREFMEYRAPNSDAWIALRAATLVSVMAYAGLRPEEAIALKVGAYLDAEKVLVVEDVFAADHRRRDTKTHVERIVSVQPALAEDLRLWLDVLRDTNPSAWMFPPTEGASVTRATHKNWTARPWRRARDKVAAEHPKFHRTLPQATPQTLRGSYVSLLARAGWSEADIAEETGHSVAILRKHYLGAIKALRNQPRLSAEDQIAQAREQVDTPRVAQALRRELLGAAARPPIRLVEPKPTP